MLELESASAGYTQGSETRVILRDLSLSIDLGETLAVVGSSGSGKTTLLRLLAGVLAPMRGAVRISPELKKVWLSPQTPVLIAFRDSLQNAMFGFELEERVGAHQIQAAYEMLDRIGLGETLRRLPDQLSGGMRRRLSLAQALLAQRPLTLLDEPFAELDSVARQRAESTLHHARQKRPVAIVMVTHDLDSVCALCERALVLAGPPTNAHAIVDIEPSLVAIASPSARRASAGFSTAVARLQKQVLEVGE